MCVMRHTPNEPGELRALAEILADWVEQAPGVTAYVFGSRVRGDHHSGSDVDVRLFPDEWDYSSQAILRWLESQEASQYAGVKARLPGPLKINRETEHDLADPYVREGRKYPVLVVRKAVCVWTPPTKHKIDLTAQQVWAIRIWAAGAHIREVRLFGSRAKGCARHDSDVDLAITALDGNYVRFADEWQEELTNSLGHKAKLKQYNCPADDTVRRYCDECCIMLFIRA
jgi:predicted nucleotidyltransferase